MLDDFLGFIGRHQLCDRKDKILLAVSGGIDSTVMLHLFKKAGFDIAVAHANFQLRGDDSEGDQLFVAEMCRTFDVPLHVRRFETETCASEKKLSVQMAARELRYGWFHALCHEERYTRIATAHHFDDAMETVLLNLTRGAGLDGLAGIPLRNGPIIRPMLFASRFQIEQYATMHAIAWREDASNKTDHYQRNFLRHHVMPLLRELNPSLDNTWRDGVQKLTHELTILQEASELWKEKYVREKPGRLVIEKSGLADHRDNPVMLWRYIRSFGFNYDQAVAIQGSIDGQPGKRFYSTSHLLVVDRDTLVIMPQQESWTELSVVSAGKVYSLGPWSLSVQMVTKAESVGLLASANDQRALLDASKVSFPLTWRKWKAGDHFYPLGFGHRKKLSDLFVDRKLSVADKDECTVVESAGEIVWVAGHRVDERYKITDSTVRYIHLVINRL